MINPDEYEIVDVLGNKVGNLRKVTSTNFIDIFGNRWKRGYSSGIGYEIRKKKMFGLPENLRL